MKASDAHQPPVRTLPITQPLAWLARGARDLLRGGWVSLAHGVALAAGGAAIAAIAHDRFWLLAGALSGFMVIAPVLATSLYALSRAMGRGERASFAVVLRTWTGWQRGADRLGNDYWCLVQFGALLALAATGWVVTSAALITLLAPVPVATPLDFLRHVVLARHGMLFELWLVLGGVLAAPIFASSVVSMPLLLDRRVTLWRAVHTSWRAVAANPLACGLWAALVLLLTLLGLATAMLGLVVLMPLLGHASWHAYVDLVDASGLALRDAPPDRAAAR
jgi:uncharacterized membrane protein